MPFQLVVKHPFGAYAIGDHITDPALVADLSKTRPEFVTQKYLSEKEATPSPAISLQSPPVPKLSSVS